MCEYDTLSDIHGFKSLNGACVSAQLVLFYVKVDGKASVVRFCNKSLFLMFGHDVIWFPFKTFVPFNLIEWYTYLRRGSSQRLLHNSEQLQIPSLSCKVGHVNSLQRFS